MFSRLEALSWQCLARDELRCGQVARMLQLQACSDSGIPKTMRKVQDICTGTLTSVMKERTSRRFPLNHSVIYASSALFQMHLPRRCRVNRSPSWTFVFLKHCQLSGIGLIALYSVSALVWNSSWSRAVFNMFHRKVWEGVFFILPYPYFLIFMHPS